MPRLACVLFFLLGVRMISFCQGQLLFDQEFINDTIKLIGMDAHYDENRTYQKYNFFITDKKVIDSLIRTVKYGSRTRNIMEHDNFSLIVTKNNRIVDRWSISPKFSNINTDGSPNFFDIDILASLSERFPMKYKYYNKVFFSTEQYGHFEDSMLLKKNTLFIYRPDFRYEGSFEVEFPKNKDFPDARKAIEYINKILEKKTDKSKFSAVYALTGYNLNNQNQITITISSPKWIFDEFNDGKAQKKSWTSAENDAIIFEKL